MVVTHVACEMSTHVACEMSVEEGANYHPE